jgi:hypothetical protein
VAIASAIALVAPAAEALGVEACVRAAEQGQADRRQHALLQARERFLTCASAACPAVVRADCARWLEEVDALVPTIAVRATSSAGDDLAAAIEIDGRAVGVPAGSAVRVDPGAHVIVVRADGFERVERRVVLVEGEKGRTLSVSLSRVGERRERPAPPPPVNARGGEERSRSPSPIVWALGGVGVAALGSFAFFGLSGRADASDLRSGCNVNGTCTETQVDGVRTKYLVADVSLGIGVVALGAAAFLALVR